MPSTDQTGLSRRELLALCSTCVSAGALAGYGVGRESDLLRSADCDPSPLDVSPTDWPAPNYDSANTRTVPREAAPGRDLTERWTISRRQPSRGQPVVTNGSVFVVGGFGNVYWLRSYDLLTGDEQWKRHVTSTPAHHALAAGGDSLFVPEFSDGDSTVSTALATADGSQRWTALVTGSSLTPALGSGLLLFQEDSDVVAIDAHTGDECWRADVGDRVRSSAATAGGLAIVNAGTDGRIVALDVRTGEQRWERDVSEQFHPDEENINDAVRARIVLGSEYAFVHTYGGRLLALDLASGDTEWVETSSDPDPTMKDGKTYAPAALEPVAFTEGALLALETYATDDPDVLYALDPDSGDDQWTYDPGETYLESPTVAGNTVYLTSPNALHLLDLTSGDSTGAYDVNGRSHYVTVADGVCLVTTSEEIVAFEAA